jgi:hypothetical protein
VAAARASTYADAVALATALETLSEAADAVPPEEQALAADSAMAVAMAVLVLAALTATTASLQLEVATAKASAVAVATASATASMKCRLCQAITIAGAASKQAACTSGGICQLYRHCVIL